ncbi:hypothetical protein [Sabulibacter ruber]|uniref:hypothetical protein n=1 Tax=Sabulibacter ruber TaxID=2811901 RepID=UPI001A959EA8|nr:hypothetical protein [Sabulibacter ruber]
MIKNILSVFAVAGVLALASCSSEPSDLRPEVKVSDDYVPPGMRNNTSNIDNASSEEEVTREDVHINHDEHENPTNTRKQEEVAPAQKSNQKEAVENHE